ncbi:MAG: efflux RND transporter periplasmic adaptor subunit [Candidatus Hydrogenedentes bacterium]|nr:efflux RND transporter periplasmic adaptor subunit [Candidatus Hydrogenedentota bacterium]
MHDSTRYSFHYRNIALAGMCCVFMSAARAQGPGQGPPPPPEVSVVTVEARTVPVTFDYVGVTEASKTVELRSRVRGFLESRDFEEGALIEEGTVLFTIDPRSFKADKDIAAARVQQAESQVALADQEVKRLKSVTVPGAVAASEVDRQIAAQAEAAASVRLAKAELAKANLELGYTTVHAPLSGLIGKAQKEIGSFVDEGTNSLLAVMHQVSPIYVSFRVSERDYLAWRTDQQSGALMLTNGEPYLELTLLDGTTYENKGAINFISNELDMNTGTYELRAQFDNPDVKLRPGQFIKAHIKGWARPGTLTIPQRAVSQSPQGAFVYVVDEKNKAEMRNVTLGEWSGDDWMVSGGLSAGERIIVEGLTKVRPGGEVVPTRLAAAEPAADGAK